VNDIIKVATVVKQIMKELSGTMPQEDKIAVITKIVFNRLMKDGC
jgi:hypothetical protein